MVCYFSEHKWLGSIYLFCFLGAQVLPKVQHYHYNLLSFKGQFSSVAHRVWLFAIPWTTARQASLSITNSQSLPKPLFIELVMPSNHLILCCPFSSCPQSFPESGSFPMCRFFTSGGQSIGALASVLPVNIQGWFPLRLTGSISLLLGGGPHSSSKAIREPPRMNLANWSLMSLWKGTCLNVTAVLSIQSVAGTACGNGILKANSGFLSWGSWSVTLSAVEGRQSQSSWPPHLIQFCFSYDG